MSRVDIAIHNKNTNELVANRGFCRTPALKFLCEESSDEKLQDFDYEIGEGIDLDKKNITSFLERIEYVIMALENMPLEDKKKRFNYPIDETLYLQFIENLKDSKKYLSDFSDNNNLDNYLIVIV
ncbi:hypothetical protein [Aureispira sp. CCB-QB1]|uniref:hypothetical protein n=1 Tax=Aureispira sp. CCB-QB1 TaxID=1313421 RepID=UPI000695C270|nr:hypothetical protein [Aureispira sp. CCB-QB1]